MKTGEKFSANGYLEKNLEAMYQKLVEEDNKDMVILVVGKPGNGKSALTLFCSRFMDPDFPLENVAYTHDGYMERIRNLDNAVIPYDEGVNSFYSRNSMTKKNKEAISTLMQFRFKNHVHFINFQNIRNLEKDLLYERCHAVIRVVKKGWAWFYSQASARNKIDLDNKKKKVKWGEPDFKDGFPDPEQRIPEIWKRYESQNESALSDTEREEDVTWIKTNEAADKIGVSPSTIRRWCDDNKLKHARLPNGDRVIALEYLEDLLEVQEPEEEVEVEA